MTSFHSSDEDEHNELMQECNELKRRLKATEKSFRNLGDHIDRDLQSENEFLSAQVEEIDEELKKERKLRKSIEEKLQTSLTAGEEMRAKIVDLKNQINVKKETDRIGAAEMEMKLALKDAEIQKLQTTLTSRAVSDMRILESTSDSKDLEITGLRSEFTAFVERNKVGDKKHQELERVITDLEDENARYSDEIMILEERLADKMSYISLMEGRLSQKNAKMSFMQEEIKRCTSARSSNDKQLLEKETASKMLENELASCEGKLLNSTKEIEHFEALLAEKMQQMSSLQNVLKAKESEVGQAKQLLEKMKMLNSESCGELQLQIESLQEQIDIKSLENTNLEANMSVLHQELDMKTSLCLDLEAKLEETISQLEERTMIIGGYEQKLKKLASDLKNETDKVENLQKELSACKDEVVLILEQTRSTKDGYDVECDKRKSQVSHLEKELLVKIQELEAKDSELGRVLEFSSDRQQEIQKLEEMIRELKKEKVQNEEESLKKENLHKQEKENFHETLQKLEASIERISSKLEAKNKENAELMIQLEEGRTRADLENRKLEELENLLHKLNSEIKSRDTSVGTLQSELASVHRDLKQALADLSQLQEVLSSNEREMKEKQDQLSIMDRKLNKSQEDIQMKEDLLKEQSAKLSRLDKSIKEQKLELKQKAVEVTQLDMSMKEQRSQLQHRLSMTEQQLQESHQELGEKLSETAELKAKVELIEEKFSSATGEVSSLQKTVQKQTEKLKEQTIKEANLLKRISELDSDVDRLRYATNELHHVREENEKMALAIADMERELTRKRQSEDALTRELDECHYLLQAKEADCTRLAKDLGASQVRERELQVKWSQELQRVKGQFEFKISRQEKEADKDSHDYSRKLAEQGKQIVSLQAKAQRAANENSLLKNDVTRMKQRLSEQDGEMKSLSQQLLEKQRYSHEAEENMLIKDAEIARLEARVSGFHRSSVANYNSKLNSSFH